MSAGSEVDLIANFRPATPGALGHNSQTLRAETTLAGYARGS